MTDYTTQILGLTGDEPPLTTEDIRRAVHFALSGWEGEWLLAGGGLAEHILSLGGGCGGWPTDHYSVSINRDRRGVLIRVKDHAASLAEHMRPGPPPPPTAVRVGRLTWRQVEDVLRAMAEPEPGEQAALFDLEVG